VISWILPCRHDTTLFVEQKCSSILLCSPKCGHDQLYRAHRRALPFGLPFSPNTLLKPCAAFSTTHGLVGYKLSATLCMSKPSQSANYVPVRVHADCFFLSRAGYSAPPCMCTDNISPSTTNSRTLCVCLDQLEAGEAVQPAKGCRASTNFGIAGPTRLVFNIRVAGRLM
jgi:hypothetical protein